MTQIPEKMLPAEELAGRRLEIMVNAYMLLVHNLRQEGVALDKVKAASDRAWQMIGEKAGATLKPLFEGAPTADMTVQSGNIATEVHGMTIRREPLEGAHRTIFEACPWHDAAEALNMPEEWRLCRGGHESFLKALYNTLDPQVSVAMDAAPPEGALCSEVIRY